MNKGTVRMVKPTTARNVPLVAVERATFDVGEAAAERDVRGGFTVAVWKTACEKRISVSAGWVWCYTLRDVRGMRLPSPEITDSEVSSMSWISLRSQEQG